MAKVLSLAVCGYEKEGGINERVAWDAVSSVTEMAPGRAGGPEGRGRFINDFHKILGFLDPLPALESDMRQRIHATFLSPFY